MKGDRIAGGEVIYIDPAIVCTFLYFDLVFSS